MGLGAILPPPRRCGWGAEGEVVLSFFLIIDISFSVGRNYDSCALRQWNFYQKKAEISPCRNQRSNIVGGLYLYGSLGTIIFPRQFARRGMDTDESEESESETDDAATGTTAQI